MIIALTIAMLSLILGVGVGARKSAIRRFKNEYFNEEDK